VDGKQKVRSSKSAKFKKPKASRSDLGKKARGELAPRPGRNHLWELLDDLLGTHIPT